MTATLAAIAPWLALAGVLVTLAVLYGRSQRHRGVAEQRAEEAEGDAAKQAEVVSIQSRRYSRSESLARLKRLLDAKRDPSEPDPPVS